MEMQRDQQLLSYLAYAIKVVDQDGGAVAPGQQMYPKLRHARDVLYGDIVSRTKPKHLLESYRRMLKAHAEMLREREKNAYLYHQQKVQVNITSQEQQQAPEVCTIM